MQAPATVSNMNIERSDNLQIPSDSMISGSGCVRNSGGKFGSLLKETPASRAPQTTSAPDLSLHQQANTYCSNRVGYETEVCSIGGGSSSATGGGATTSGQGYVNFGQRRPL